MSTLHLPWRNSAVRNDAAAEIIDKALEILHAGSVFDGAVATENARKALAAAAGEIRVPSRNRSKVARALLQAQRQNTEPLRTALSLVAMAINGRGYEHVFTRLIPASDADEIATKHRFFDACPSGVHESDLWHAFMALWKADAFKHGYEHVGAPWDPDWDVYLERVNMANPAVSLNALSFADVRVMTYGLIMRDVQ